MFPWVLTSGPMKTIGGSYGLEDYLEEELHLSMPA